MNEHTPADYLVGVAVRYILRDPNIKSASCYQSPTLVIKATRHGKPDKRRNHTQIVLTIGKPNFRGRAFVRACLKAGEPFPVKKVQLKFAAKK